MALYDVWIDGWSMSNPRLGYAVDGFEGRRAVATPRVIEETGQGPGLKVIPGAPDPFPVVLSMWIDGKDSANRFESNLDYVMRALQHRRGQNLNVEWEDVTGKRRSAECRLLRPPTPEISHTTNFARLEIPLENVSGAWRGPSLSGSTKIGGTISPQGASTATIWDAQIEITGPVKNPRVQSGGGFVQFIGDVPAKKKLALRSYPASAVLDGKPVVRNLRYAGSDSRLFDIYPGETVKVTGSGAGTGSGWKMTYRPAYA